MSKWDKAIEQICEGVKPTMTSKSASDYIKREDAIKSIKPMVGIWADDGRFYVDYQRVLDIINNELSADVAEVVRCKDCKYYLPKQAGKPFEVTRNYCNKGANKATKSDDYCSYGERKEHSNEHTLPYR